MDSVDAHFTDEWITKIAAALGERAPDYFIVQHMEPDHFRLGGRLCAGPPGDHDRCLCAGLQHDEGLLRQSTMPTAASLSRKGTPLPLGRHTLHFVTAPMVHWPEVIMTYDDADKVLFSADAFGKFGALDVEEPWLPEARRYFIGIVGKYGAQVQAVLQKAAGLDIETVCSLHGPVLHKGAAGRCAGRLRHMERPTALRRRACWWPTTASTATPLRPLPSWPSAARQGR